MKKLLAVFVTLALVTGLILPASIVWASPGTMEGTILADVFEWIAPGATQTGNPYALRLSNNGGIEPGYRFETTPSFTIDFYWRYNSGTGLAYMWNDLDSTSAGFRAFTNGIAGNGLLFRNVFGGSDINLSNLNVQDGNWYHIRLVLDADANTFTVYIDGVQRGQSSYDGSGFKATDTFRAMGQSSGSTTLIDYDRYVWVNEAVHYPDSIADSPVLVYYELNEGSGTTVFSQVETYELSTGSTLGGEVTTPGEGAFIFAKGSAVAIQASPNEGYHFVNWTGDVATIADQNQASTTITMSGDHSITAVFHAILEGPDYFPVSMGSEMLLDPSEWFPENGWEYTVESSDPGVVAAQITPEGQLLLEALGMGSSLITVTATNPQTGEQHSHAFWITVTAQPDVLSSDFRPFEPWNPRFEQLFEVHNNSGFDAIGIRLLFSNLADGITVENQTGFAPDGRAVIDWIAPFPDGATETLSVVYLATGAMRPDQHPSTVEVQFILSQQPGVPDNLGAPFISDFRILPDGRQMLEFASVPGRAYMIEYSDEAPTGQWTPVPTVTITAGANRTQWLNTGPPTIPESTTGMRFYRVREVLQ